MMAATSGMGPVPALNHRLRGLVALRSLRALDAQVDPQASRANKAIASFAERLEEIHRRVQAAPVQFLLIGEAHHDAQLHQDLATYWTSSPQSGERAPFALPDELRPVRQAWVTSTQVNYCAKAYTAVPGGHPDAAALTVLGSVLRNEFLHRAVREQGGAYGAGASYEADEGTFRFYSYRDPRFTQTLKDFDAARDWLLALEPGPDGRGNADSARQVEEAILSVISSMDRPASPAGEARKAFHNALTGRTPEYLQRLRQRILQVRLQDLQRVAGHYLRPEQASVAAITSEAALAREGDSGLAVEKW
jgi:Zn-dependent M16 (insulinase) family peptidase